MAESLPLDWGSRLRRERERRRWSRKFLANRIEVAPASIFRWEEEDRKPQKDLLQKLIAVFGKPVDAWGTSTWMLPYLRNVYFTGRQDILHHLHTVLQRREVAAVSQPEARAVSGLGGIGKTQTAVEYAYRYGKDYDLVLWVLADSRTTLVSHLAGLASHFGVGQQGETDQYRLARAVKGHLETQEEQVWLLILDNVEDLQVVQEFLPTRGNGAVLLTTRLPDVGSSIRKLDLDTLTREEGVQFLQARLGAGAAQEQHVFTAAERQAAEHLWTLLGGLPLALDQAAAFVQETGYSLAEYRTLFQHASGALLRRRGQQATEHLESVAVTFELAWKQVHQLSPAAADLLRLCAFLAPDAIPEEVFTEQEAWLPPALREALKPPVGWQEVLGVLRRYSLLGRQAKTKTLTVHRLVQAVLREELDPETQHTWAERVVHLVDAAFPDGSFATWDRCERLMPHVLVCVDHVKKWQLASEEVGHLFHRAGEYFALRARYGEALALTQQALSIREQVLVSPHPDVASSLNNVGYIYNELGRHKEALTVYQQAMTIREQTLEPTHPDRTESLNNLAEVYRELGQYAEALPLFQQALAIREQTLGPNDPNVADYLNNLALLYQAQGHYDQAQQCFQRALTILEQALEPTDPRLAVGLNNLGGVFRVQGQNVEAQQCFQQALAISEQALGSDNAYVAHSLYNLAELYQAQERYDEALPLYQRVLPMLEQELGPDHSSVAIRLNNLANLHQARGQNAEALPLYQRALAIREQALGAQHPDTAETMHDLARLREAQGSHEEARGWYERALAAREQALRAHHPKTRQTRQRVIALLQTMGQRDEAARLERAQEA